MIRESVLEHRLAEGVKAAGGLSYKWVSPGQVGVPDRVVILPGGKIIFIELKTAIGKLSAFQRIQLERLSKLGADVRVLKGTAEVEAFLWEIRNL